MAAMNQQPTEEERFYKAANEKMEQEKKDNEAFGKLIFCGLPLLFLIVFVGLLVLTSLFRQ